MRLIVDTNILIRCSRGRAARYVDALLLSGVALTTTDRNADEMRAVLRQKFDFMAEQADEEVQRVSRPIELLAPESYEPFRPEADRRLCEGGKPDWPVLSAAIALDCAIWSEDIDFFGTGVPVWKTANVLLCAAENRN